MGRLTKSKMDKLRSWSSGESVYSVDYWSYTKTPIKQSLTVIPDPSLEENNVRMFHTALVYAGIEEQNKGDGKYRHTHIHRYTYTYIHTYTHKHIYTHTHR